MKKKLPDRFDQVYIQTYEGENDGLPPHHDNRADLEELIVGVTITGTSDFFLGMDPYSMKASQMKETPKRRKIVLDTGSMYVLSGVSRYVLKHSVVHNSSERRVSLTFRSVASK